MSVIAAEIYLAQIALVNRVARMGTCDYTCPAEATVGQLGTWARAALCAAPAARKLKGKDVVLVLWLVLWLVWAHVAWLRESLFRESDRAAAVDG